MLYWLCMVFISALILTPKSVHACGCACHLTGFSSDSSSQCCAVTDHGTPVARATRIRKNNMKQFKKHVSEQKAREWKRLSHFLHHLSCNWRLSSLPVGASRDEVNRVHKEAKSSRTIRDKRSVTSVSLLMISSGDQKNKRKRIILDFDATFTTYVRKHDLQNVTEMQLTDSFAKNTLCFQTLQMIPSRLRPIMSSVQFASRSLGLQWCSMRKVV